MRRLGGRLLTLFGELSRLFRFALGIKGVRWAAVAIMIGLACCVGALMDFAISLERADGTHGRALVGLLLGTGCVVGAGLVLMLLIGQSSIRHRAQRELAERTIEAERTRLRSIVESSGALVLLADRDLAVVMVNSGFVEMTGIARGSAVGRPLREIVEWPLDARQFENWRHGARGENDTVAARLTCRHLDATGKERLLNVTAKPTLGRTGEALQFVFVGVDDTERRDVEQALFATERLAAVGEMSAAVAHEIAQPLQVINLACQSALDELGEHADAGAFDVSYVRQKLDRIAGQIERSNRIVGDLRAFVRGVGSDDLHPFDPADAVRSAIDLTAHGLQQARVKLTVSVEEGDRQVMGHVGKLEQVLVNLINNAKDAGGSTVDVLLRTERHDDSADKVRITVQDSGPGISPEVLQRLFNAFITTKPRGKGTGLGLRVCRRIVEEMEGTITGGNRVEGGARFEVLLPVVAAQPC